MSVSYKGILLYSTQLRRLRLLDRNIYDKGEVQERKTERYEAAFSMASHECNGWDNRQRFSWVSQHFIREEKKGKSEFFGLLCSGEVMLHEEI
jgi:hypothetical protein